MAVEGCHDEQHGEEHGHQTDDDGGGLGVDDEDNAAGGAEGPDSSNDAARSPHCHDVVVPQSVEDGDIPAEDNTLFTDYLKSSTPSTIHMSFISCPETHIGTSLYIFFLPVISVVSL